MRGSSFSLKKFSSNIHSLSSVGDFEEIDHDEIPYTSEIVHVEIEHFKRDSSFKNAYFYLTMSRHFATNFVDLVGFVARISGTVSRPVYKDTNVR